MVEHEDTLVVDLAVLVCLKPDILPGSQTVADKLCHIGQPRPRAWFRPIDDHKLDLGMRPVTPTEVPAFPVRVDRAHEVEVRRHCLVVQAEVGEGAIVVEVGDEPRDFAVADMEQLGHCRVRLPKL